MAPLASTEMVSKLHARGIIASDTPVEVPDPRLTPGLLNDPEDVRRTIAAVEAIVRG